MYVSYYCIWILSVLFRIQKYACNGETYDSYVCSAYTNLISFQSYELWETEDHEGRNLFCPVKSFFNDKRKNQFCSCCAIPGWKLHNNITISDLRLEHVSRSGLSFLQRDENDARFHRIKMENGFLTEIPLNFCHFPSIVEIYLKGNKIKWLPSLSCLTELDTIDLSYNVLTFISNFTFVGLRKLRRIDLSHNLITVIQPFTINQVDQGILMADFSFNKLKVIDITNNVIRKTFCYVSYQHNDIVDITNEINIHADDFTFGSGGYVNWAGNTLRRLPDPRKFGINSMADLGRLFFDKYLFDIRYNKILCDCQLETFLRAALGVRERYEISGTSFAYYCYYPIEMRDTKPITDLLTEDYLDRFICNLTSCQPGCKCYYQTSRQRIVINCTSVGVTNLNDIDLTSFQENTYSETKTNFLNAKVHAYLSNNSITNFDKISYMNKIGYIDLSKNRLNQIKTNALRHLPADAIINVSFNPDLHYLPQQVQRFRYEQISMDGLNLMCSCEDDMYKWLSGWLPSNNPDHITCHVENEKIKVEKISAQLLGCSTNYHGLILRAVVPMVILISLISTLSYASYFFRHEIYFLYRQFRQKNCPDGMYVYDVYISVDESNPLLTRWLMTTFIPILKYRGYNVYFPFRDTLPGEFKEESILNKISKSRCILVFMTKSSVEEEDPWMAIEWRYAWKHYICYYSSRLLLINFDLMRMASVPCVEIKAIIRLGYDVNFCSRMFIKEVIRRLGSPVKRKFGLKNRKLKFCQSRLRSKIGTMSRT